VDQRQDQREFRMGRGMPAEQHQRVVDVAQGAEGGVHRRVLEHRARVEHALELGGGQAPGVQGELLDAAQAADRAGVGIIRWHGRASSPE
jgi:hypothetical protein